MAEENCPDRDTVGPEPVDLPLIGERNAGWSQHRAAVDTEMLECSKTSGGRVGERVAVVHKEVAWSAQCTLGWWFSVIFLTGL